MKIASTVYNLLLFKTTYLYTLDGKIWKEFEKKFSEYADN